MPSKYKLAGILLGIVLGSLLAISYFHAVQKPPRSGVGLAVDTAQGILPILAQYPHRASSCYQKYYASNLSDNNPDSFWHVAEVGKPAWVIIDFGTSSGDVINSFQALPRKDALAQFWRQAVLQGSNNARFWTNLADVSAYTEPASAEWFTWYFDSQKRYRYYRLFVTSGFSQGKDFVAFAEWKLNHVDTSTVPSLQLQHVSPAPFLADLLAALSYTTLFIAAGLLVALTLVSFAVLGWIAALKAQVELVIKFLTEHGKALLVFLHQTPSTIVKFLTEHGKALLVRSALIASVCLAITFLTKLAGLMTIGIFAVPAILVIYVGYTAGEAFPLQFCRLVIFNIFLTLLCFSVYIFSGDSPQKEYVTRALLHKAPPNPNVIYKASHVLGEYFPENLGDMKATGFWHVPERIQGPIWVELDYGPEGTFAANVLSARPRPDDPSQFWKTARLEGSEDGIRFKKIADVSQQKCPPKKRWVCWSFKNEEPYRYYRVWITSGHSGVRQNFVSLANLVLARHKPESPWKGLLVGWLAGILILIGGNQLPRPTLAPIESLSNAKYFLSITSKVKESLTWLAAGRHSEAHYGKEIFFLTAILLCYLVSLKDLLIWHKKTFVHDGVTDYGIFHFFAESLCNGYWPLWNPYMHGGEPFYYYWHRHILLDPTILFPAVALRFFNISMFDMYHYMEIGRLLIQVIGAYLLFRKVFTYALSTYVSLVTLLFGPLASVALISRTYIDSVQWFPWILYLIIRLVEGGGIRELVYIAFLTGIAMGGPLRGDTIQVLFAISLFAVSLLITHRNAMVGVLARQKPVYLGLCLLLGTFLCAHVASLSKDTDKIFPIMGNEYRMETVQSILSPQIADVYSESVRDIVRLLLPVKKHIWPYLDRWDADFLIGIIPVLLFWVGLIIGRNRFKANFLILMLFMAFVAMGQNTVMLQIVRTVFPPMKQTVFITTSAAMMFLAHGFFIGLCIDAIVSLINNRKSTINDDNNKGINGRSYYTLQDAKSFLLQWDISIRPFIVLFLVFAFVNLNIYRNTYHETSEMLLHRPIKAKFPKHLKDKIRYDAPTKLLILKGVMSRKDSDDLINLTPDKTYKKALTTLFKKSRVLSAYDMLYAMLSALVATTLVYLLIKAIFIVARRYSHPLSDRWLAWKTAWRDGTADSPILRWCTRYWPLMALFLTPIVLAFALHQEKQLISLPGLLLMLTCLIIIYASTTLTQNLASIARGALAVACIFFILLLYEGIELPGKHLLWVLYGEFILLGGMVFYYLSKRLELNNYSGFLLILSVAVACELFMVHKTYLIYHLRDRDWGAIKFNTRPQKPQMTNRIPLLPWTNEYQPWDTPFRPIYYRENVAIDEILSGKEGVPPTEETTYAKAYSTPKCAPSCNFWPKTYLWLYEIGEVNLKVFEELMGLKSGQALLDFYPQAIVKTDDETKEILTLPYEKIGPVLESAVFISEPLPEVFRSLQVETSHLNPLKARPGFEYKVLKYNPNHLEIEVNASEDGLLHFRDGYDNYWLAFVDGKQTKVYRSNLAFKAVPLTKGQHVVVFDYYPVYFMFAFRLYLLAMGGFFIFMSYDFVRYVRASRALYL